MFQEITYYQILGLPFIVYLGIITFLSFFVTASIAIMRRRGKTNIPIQWHFRMAYVSIILGIIHGAFGISAYF
jgi:hypothetical protein